MYITPSSLWLHIMIPLILCHLVFVSSQNQEGTWAPNIFDGTICHPFFAADISLTSSHVARMLPRFRKQCAPDSSATQLVRILRKATRRLWITRLFIFIPPVPFLTGNQTGKLHTHMSATEWSPLSRESVDPNRTNLCGSVHTYLMSLLPSPNHNWQGDLPWVGADDQGVHARGDSRRPQMACRVCPCLLSVLWPNKTQPTEEAAKDRASIQQVINHALPTYLSFMHGMTVVLIEAS